MPDSSGNVLPELPANYQLDGVGMYAEPAGKLLRILFSFSVTSSHFNNFIFSKLRVTVLAAFSWFASSLDHSVSVVVGHRSNEQMKRVAARLVIASVEHTHSFWDWSVTKLVRNAMRSQNPSVNRTLPISMPATTFPRPTVKLLFHVNSRPEHGRENIGVMLDPFSDSRFCRVRKCLEVHSQLHTQSQRHNQEQ